MRLQPMTSSDPVSQLAERRVHPRFPLCVEVDFTSEHNFYTGFTQDIGEGGLFISTYSLMEIGDRFHLSFTLPGIEEAFEAVCEVRWVRTYNPDSDAGPGMGVRFCGLSARMRSRIQHFLNRRQSLFFVD